MTHATTRMHPENYHRAHANSSTVPRLITFYLQVQRDPISFRVDVCEIGCYVCFSGTHSYPLQTHGYNFEKSSDVHVVNLDDGYQIHQFTRYQGNCCY